MQLTPANLDYIFDYIEQLCGIVLDDTKGYLIEARLGPLMKQHAVQSPVELIDKAKSVTGDSVRKSLVEAMTTRETFFFRDNAPFEALQFKALPELLDCKLREKNRRLRIWSAAASSGQEACSISIVLHEMIPDLHQWDIQIVATDISEEAIARGKSGMYSKLEVERGMPPHYIKKYCAPHKDGYKIMDSVHRMIRFQQMNLLEPFRFTVPFDIIFCRNVAIYFEKKVKIDLFRRMLSIMPRYGYLFVGVSESLFDCGPEFKPMYHCRSTFYQPNIHAAPVAPNVTASAPILNASVPAVRPANLTPTKPSTALPPSKPTVGSLPAKTNLSPGSSLSNSTARKVPTASPAIRSAVPAPANPVSNSFSPLKRF